MPRALPVCAVLLALPLAAYADEPTETVVRLTVTPAPAPKPALKYQLLPELRDMNPGNPIPAYLRCFMEQNNFFYNKEAVDNREKWQTMPLKELPLKEIRNSGYRKDGGPTSQADYAARLDTPDWQIILRLRSDSFSLLIPDVPQLRMLAAALKVRFRADVAERHFDDAAYTAQTMFALSRHLGEHPTLIGNLVGLAIASLAVGPLEEMIGQPGSPNLYWALTDLPHPFLDLRKGIQGERLMWKAEFTALLDPYAPVSPATRRLVQSLARPPKSLLDDSPPTTDEARLQKAVGRVRLLLVVLSGPDQNKAREEAEIRKWLEDRARDEAYMKAARKRLAERGLAGDKLKQLSGWQVVLHNEVLAYEDRNDEAFKTVALPYWEAAPLLERLRADQTKGLFGRGANYVEKVRMAQTRLEQRLALLRVVEALRLHAAEHGGNLPAKLADVKVPLPVDPVTGKPFAYELKDGTAILHGTPPRGMEKSAAYNVRYEVSMAK